MLYNVQNRNVKCGKMPAKQGEEILWNKVCVFLISPYAIRRKRKKVNLNLKFVTMIDSIVELFKIIQ